MSRTDAYLLILGMAAVTYIPRALPAFLMDKLALKKCPLIVCVLAAVGLNGALYLIL